jgi:tetratricopeptide (TPR) repeat protein
MKKSLSLLIVVLGVCVAWAQSGPAANGSAGQQAKQASSSDSSGSDRSGQPDSDDKSDVESAKPDKAAAYYHYMQAHMYEEMVALYGRVEYANKAIEEFKLAIQNDPSSEYLNSGLAELYIRAGRPADAVRESEILLKRDPNNVEAHRLLGRIYLRSLGDMQAGSQSQEVLKKAIEQYEEIVKLDPKSADDHVLLGRLYRLDNDMVRAEAEFKTAVKLQPDSEDAVTTLAYLYNEEGDANRAIKALQTIPESERSGKLYSALGYTYEQQKDYKNAIVAYQHAVDEDEENLDAQRGLAQNLLNDGQLDAALQQYKVIVEADPQDPQSLMRMAEIYRREGKFDAALDSLNKAESLVQDSFEVPYNKAVIYQAQGRVDEATQILQSLVQRTEKPGDNYSSSDRNNRAIFLERLGNIYRDNGKSQLAINTFRKMLVLGDDNASRGYQEIIETQRQDKNWTDALATAKEAVGKLPNDRDLKMVYASQLADNGQVDEGLAMVNSLLKGSSEDREVYLALCQMYSRLKRWKEAETALTKARDLSTKPEDIDYINFLQASMYERQKRYDEAEEVFKSVLTANPNNAMVLNYLGYMLADRGVRLQEALGYIKKAVQIEPQNPAYLDSLGWAYFKLGNYDLAEENLRRASDHMGNDPTIQDHLGELYAHTGRLKLAAAHWERAIDEWNHSVPAEVDQTDFRRVQKSLDSTKVKLAKQQGERKAEVSPKP